jgi:hypothetical protein
MSLKIFYIYINRLIAGRHLRTLISVLRVVALRVVAGYELSLLRVGLATSCRCYELGATSCRATSCPATRCRATDWTMCHVK